MSWLRTEVLRRADIVEVVSEYLPLRKRGSNYWALSPFKPERTPSFAVSPSKQIFKCFSSGKGGDVIRFVMEIEGLSYAEALRKLAQKYNIEVSDFSEHAQATKERQRYTALYQEAAQFFQRKLKDSPASLYLEKRGLRPDTIERFGLGYAPAEGNALTRYLLQLGYSEETLVSWGLSLRNEHTGRLYDRFRHRVMFPIHDEYGSIVAFAGRSLGEEEPKYLNSPETPFYQKSEILYGLHQARGCLRQGIGALIVEGYMDVISLHQAGFTQAVATCGTALTPAHVTKLKRYTREVILMYDSDTAGRMATERAITTALSVGFFVRVVSLPAKDPDELLQTAGSEAFQELLKTKQSWTTYLSSQSPMLPDAPERYHLLQKLGQNLQVIPDPLLRRVYADEIQQSLHIPLEFWESFQQMEQAAALPKPQQRQRITAEKELIRIAFTYPSVSHGGIPLWQLLQEEWRHLVFAEEPAEAIRCAFCEWELPFPPTPPQLAERLSPEAQDWLAEVLMEKYVLSPHWRSWDDSPLEEDPALTLESNLNLLHLNHLQRLLEENLLILTSLSPDTPTYEEHLSLHQVLLRQRAELARRQGVILPYRNPSLGPEEEK
ncbi:MAG: DNA primase [Bacteroidia bacterium]|nr:DNA primase [Bacteroidia bacterium]